MFLQVLNSFETSGIYLRNQQAVILSWTRKTHAAFSIKNRFDVPHGWRNCQSIHRKSVQYVWMSASGVRTAVPLAVKPGMIGWLRLTDCFHRKENRASVRHTPNCKVSVGILRKSLRNYSNLRHSRHFRILFRVVTSFLKRETPMISAEIVR